MDIWPSDDRQVKRPPDPPPRRRAPRFARATIKRQPLLLLAGLGSLAGTTVEQRLSKLDLDSREFAVLDLLVRANGPMAQSAIAFHLRRDRTTTMRLTRSLARKRLVTMMLDPGDGRVRAVTATRRGIERYRQADGALLEGAVRFMWLLSDEQRHVLVEGLRRLL